MLYTIEDFLNVKGYGNTIKMTKVHCSMLMALLLIPTITAGAPHLKTYLLNPEIFKNIFKN
jgi:hypothetical protein